MGQAIDGPGRVALVSGGSRGIGAAIVRRLAADGWDVGFSYLDDGPSAREVEKAAFELGVRAIGTDVDITDAAEVGTWFRLTEDELGPVHAVVSCAGITREQPLARLAEADWRTVIDTTLDGVFHLCRTAVFAMMERRSGRIVAVSSVCRNQMPTSAASVMSTSVPIARTPNSKAAFSTSRADGPSSR